MLIILDELTAHETCRSDGYLLFGAMGMHRAAFSRRLPSRVFFLVKAKIQLAEFKPFSSIIIIIISLFA